MGAGRIKAPVNDLASYLSAAQMEKWKEVVTKEEKGEKREWTGGGWDDLQHIKLLKENISKQS